MSDSSQPHGLQPTRLLRPWDFPGKSTGVGCHRLLLTTPKILPRIWFWWVILSLKSVKVFIILSLKIIMYHKSFFFFYFTILYWFCRTLTWIRHGCTCVLHPEPPSHLPPHTIPLGHPSAPAPSILYHASNPDWRFVSHMIIYVFQFFSDVKWRQVQICKVGRGVCWLCILSLSNHMVQH